MSDLEAAARPQNSASWSVVVMICMALTLRLLTQNWKASQGSITGRRSPAAKRRNTAG
jgi:hypothetical protein